jgi:DNA modification methylase/ParB-like chromosome segregation protein Spo0J
MYTSPEYSSLKESVGKNGQYSPIIINSQGILLDGYHRFKACQELGIEPKILVQDFKDNLREQLFVIESNLQRRQMNRFQRAELALKAKPILEAIARNNESLGGKGVRIQTPLGRVDVEIGKRAGVGRDTVRKVEIISQGDDEDLKEKARKGQFTINQAFNKLKRAEKRNALLNEHSIPFVEQQEHGPKLLNGDFMEQSKEIPDNSIDLILTDPPYDKGSIPLYRKLASLAGRVLKDGGSLMTYASNCWLPDIFRNMLPDIGIRYWWTFSVIHSGGHQLVYQRNVFAEWKPLLWFVKGEKIREGILMKNMGDLIESQPPDKSLDEWTQSPIEAEFIIDNLTVENQLVLDPFMGVGTFGLAALKLKRQFIGIEIDPEKFGIAKTNLGELKTDAGNKN